MNHTFNVLLYYFNLRQHLLFGADCYVLILKKNPIFCKVESINYLPLLSHAVVMSQTVAGCMHGTFGSTSVLALHKLQITNGDEGRQNTRGPSLGDQRCDTEEKGRDPVVTTDVNAHMKAEMSVPVKSTHERTPETHENWLMIKNNHLNESLHQSFRRILLQMKKIPIQWDNFAKTNINHLF